jgi:hypothetical protein
MSSPNSYHPQDGKRWFLSYRVTNPRLLNHGRRRIALQWPNDYMQFPDVRAAHYFAESLGMKSVRVLRARQDHWTDLYERATR